MVPRRLYAKVVKRMVEAIRAETRSASSSRTGRKCGSHDGARPCPFGVAQSTRGYEPMGVTHYRADWVKGSDAWAVPSSPVGRLDPFLFAGPHGTLRSARARATRSTSTGALPTF